MTDMKPETRALYGQTLIELTNDELMHEKLVQTNAMLEENVKLFNARKEPTLETVLEQLQKDAVLAMEKLAMIDLEIMRRQDEYNEQQRGIADAYEQMHEQLQEAQKDALEDMLDKARDLTDLVQTGRAAMLTLAGSLPTEARYDPETSSYPRLHEVMQDAARALVESYSSTGDVLRTLERAVRCIHLGRKYFLGNLADPEEDITTEDGIPF